MRELVRSHLRFFILVSFAALGLRLAFILRFPAVVNDSFVYGDIAKNWLQHGVYGLSSPEGISPTYIRLPGYPAFLALMFSIFGMEHYRAVLVVQMFLDLGTCLLCADIARRLFGPRSAKTAFLLTAFCPFLANYTAAALTETLEIFFTALGLNLALRSLQNPRGWGWAACGAACGAAMLLRPDGALLLIAVVAYLLAGTLVRMRKAALTSAAKTGGERGHFRNALIVLVIAMLPLIPWTLRNWHLFHRFQPLAPRYANEENEFVPMGFNHWTKSWIADYVSVEEIYWAVPGTTIDPASLPRRAFDTPRQKQQTLRLIADYNKLLHVSPALDTKFEAIADQRRHADALRYYVGLPILRILDMWLRPRTEMLPSDSRWWEFNDEPRWSALAVALGAINLGYVLCALAGWLQFRKTPLAGMLVLFVLVRSAFLGTLENPEPRYTLEMYPVVIVLAAAALAREKTNTPQLSSV